MATGIDLGQCESQQNQLNKDIQTRTFRPFYLIWGSEPYLRRQCLNELTTALMEGSDPSNKLVMREDKGGKKPDLQEALNFAETMPFFGKRRVVVIESDSLFKKSCKDGNEYFANPVEGAVVVFVAEEVDTSAASTAKSPSAGQNRSFYSIINGIGRTVRCEPPNMTYLSRWIDTKLLHPVGKKMDAKTTEFFIRYLNADMMRIGNEIEKLIAYTAGQEEITVKDITAICQGIEDTKIYNLTDAIADKNKKAIIREYEVLLLMNSKPNELLAGIIRQFRNIMITAELVRRHMDTSVICECVGIKPGYPVTKHIKWAQQMQEIRLIQTVDYCLRIDRDIKNGTLDATVALEMLLAYCMR